MDNISRINNILDKWKNYINELNKNKNKIPAKEVREKLKEALNRIFDLFTEYEEEAMPDDVDNRKLVKNLGVNQPEQPDKKDKPKK